MWLEITKYQQIGSALQERKKRVLARILTSIHSTEEASSNIPAVCPKCHKKLIRQALPYVELLVKACPEKHGVWMSSDVTKKLKGFIHDYLSSAKGTPFENRTVVKILLIVFALAAGYFFVVGTPQFMMQNYSNGIDGIRADSISTSNWPMRGVGKLKTLPSDGSAIDNPDEFRYFQTMLALLDAAVSNRVNMADVLGTQKQAENYESIFRFYEEKQYILLQAMKELNVPDRITRFHEHLISSLESQIRFYAYYTNQKIKDAGLKFDSLKSTIDRMEANREILNAWSLFLSYYSDLDTPTYNAVYQRLAWMDVG